jgi:hypothetical protein
VAPLSAPDRRDLAVVQALPDSPPAVRTRRSRGGRRALKGGATRLLGTHDGAQGRAFTRCWDALAAHFPLDTPLVKLEASRVAAAWVNLEHSTKALADARRVKAPAREVEQKARRAGLDDGSYQVALNRLESMVQSKPPLDLATRVARLHGAS